MALETQDQVDTDEQGYITVKPGTPETSVEGVFAAGDVQDKEWRQVCRGLSSADLRFDGST